MMPKRTITARIWIIRLRYWSYAAQGSSAGRLAPKVAMKDPVLARRAPAWMTALNATDDKKPRVYPGALPSSVPPAAGV